MARTLRLDMTGVETFSKASEGIHTVKVAEIQEKDSQNGDPMLQFIFEVINGEDKGCKVFESFVLTDKALWRFKAFLMAIDVKCDGKIKLDLDKLIGKVCDIEVFWDEYNGQTRAKIADYYKAGKGNADTDDEEEEEEEEEEETPKKTPAKRGRPAGAKNKKKPEPESDDEDDDEDTDEDEEESVKRKGRKPRAKVEKPEKKKPEPEDDEDDDEWEEDDD